MKKNTFSSRRLTYLAPTGILVYLIPLSRLAHPRICTLLTTWCTDLTVLRFPSPEYEVFKQGIVLGMRKARGERNPAAAGYWSVKSISPLPFPRSPSAPIHFRVSLHPGT